MEKQSEEGVAEPWGGWAGCKTKDGGECEPGGGVGARFQQRLTASDEFSPPDT